VITVGWARIDDAPTDLDVLNASARLAERAWPDDERRRIVGARLLLRDLVTREVGAGRTIVLRQRCERCGGPHGRPMVEVDGRPGPHVSISHAGALAVVAVAPSAVGVDVEPERNDIAVDEWVRTEAVAKATGRGLDDAPLPRARVRHVAVAPGYVAAVAVLRRRPTRIRVAPVIITPR
jgi:4'-phosphopantetheinyl transferase